MRRRLSNYWSREYDIASVCAKESIAPKVYRLTRSISGVGRSDWCCY